LRYLEEIRSFYGHFGVGDSGSLHLDPAKVVTRGGGGGHAGRRAGWEAFRKLDRMICCILAMVIKML